MKAHRLISVIGAGALSAVTLAAWSSPTRAPAATASSKTIVMALNPLQSPNWFFPVISASAYAVTNLQAIALSYLPLLDITKTDAINWKGSLISGVKVNAQDTQFTLTMNPKFHWSDGRPVSAQDVVFNWDVMKAASAPNAVWPYGGAGIGGVPADWKSVVAKNARTVVISTTQPVNPTWFIYNGIGQLEPVPAFVWNKYPSNMNRELQFIAKLANSPNAPQYRVVDGPFRFQSFQANNYWSWVPNPHFDGHKATIGKFMLKYETSSASEFVQLRSGTVNVGYIEPSQWGARGQLNGNTVDTTYLFGFSSMSLNENVKAPGGLGPYFAQQYVRAALQMGVNQPGIIKGIYHGLGVQSYGPLSSKPNSVFYNPLLSKPAYPYNPAAGKRLLEQHGWKDVNGVMTKGKVKLAFTVEYITGTQATNDMMQELQHSWAQEGIKVALDPQPLDTVLSVANQSNPSKWSMAGPMNWTYEPDYYPSGDGLFTTGGASNNNDYNNAEADKLILESTSPASAAVTKRALFAYEAYLRKSNPVIYLPWAAGSYTALGFLLVHANNVHGTLRTFNPISDLLYPNLWTVK